MSVVLFRVTSEETWELEQSSAWLLSSLLGRMRWGTACVLAEIFGNSPRWPTAFPESHGLVFTFPVVFDDALDVPAALIMAEFLSRVPEAQGDPGARLAQGKQGLIGK